MRQILCAPISVGLGIGPLSYRPDLGHERSLIALLLSAISGVFLVLYALFFELSPAVGQAVECVILTPI